MGGLFSSNVQGVEEVDSLSSCSYRYPPTSGSYFADHFIMGGSRFDTTQPEAYLFGENNDLNYLSPKPVPFPYPSPHGNEPTKTLRCLVNLRKDTLKLVKCEDTGDDETYHIQFTFDADANCSVTIHYQATEDLSTGLALYSSKDPSMTSKKFSYKKGAGQLFNHSLQHRFRISQFNEEEFNYNPLSSTHIPIVIQIDVDDEEFLGHSHITMATIDGSDGSYIIKPIKQKQMVDGLCFLLQEIYGIENKAVSNKGFKDDDDDDCNEFDAEETGLECVICMCEMRDTLILPCRHLCLCRACADSLRYQSSNCPICRSAFHALLQICAYVKKTSTDTRSHQGSNEGEDYIPGYEQIPLVEALNGRIAPDNIPEEAIARMRRRSSSLRSSGRRAPSRTGSTKSQRRMERSQSARSSRRPGTAPSIRSEQIQAAPTQSDDNVIDVSPFKTADVHEVPVRDMDDDEDEPQEVQVHVDVSLPGTPLGSENSVHSGGSRKSVTPSFSSVVPATPTCVQLEESIQEMP